MQSVPPGSDPSSGESPRLRVDFYILEETSVSARLRVACRIAEKACLAAQTVLVWHDDGEELKALDELLWTFSDRSFVPHETLAAGARPEAPVLLSSGALPPERIDVIINLAADVPPCHAQAMRIAEIVDGDDSRRRAGRARFKIYRDLGVQPISHNLRGDQPAP